MQGKIEKDEKGEKMQTVTVKLKVSVISRKEFDKVLAKGSWLTETILDAGLEGAVRRQLSDMLRQIKDKTWPKEVLRTTESRKPHWVELLGTEHHIDFKLLEED